MIKQKILYLSVDEKSVMKGYNYFTIVYNLDKGTVDRKTDSLKAYFDHISSEQKSLSKL